MALADDNKRAQEILTLIEECHDSLTCLYEALIDKESKEANQEIKGLIDDINKLSKFI